jgi:hypothetical protein
VKTVLERLSSDGDAWHAIKSSAVSLTAARKRLGEALGER